MFNRTIRKLILGSLLLVAGSIGIYCADPPENTLFLNIDFSQIKGQFDYLDSTEIPDEYGQYINNIDWSINGLLTPLQIVTGKLY